MNKKLIIGIVILFFVATSLLILSLPKKIKINEAYFIEDAFTLKQHSPMYEIGEEVLLYVDIAPIKLKKINNEYNLNLVADQKIVDKNGKVIDYKKDVVVYDKNLETKSSGLVLMIPYETINLTQGAYTLQTIFTNKHTNERKVIENDLILKNTGILMTTPIFGYEIEDEFEIMSMSSFTVGENFSVYFELSNYAMRNGEADLAFDIKLENEEEGVVLFDAANLISDKVNYTKYSRTIPIDSAVLTPGVYAISITAKDLISNSQVKRKARFEII